MANVLCGRSAVARAVALASVTLGVHALKCHVSVDVWKAGDTNTFLTTFEDDWSKEVDSKVLSKENFKWEGDLVASIVDATSKWKEQAKELAGEEECSLSMIGRGYSPTLQQTFNGAKEEFMKVSPFTNVYMHAASSRAADYVLMMIELNWRQEHLKTRAPTELVASGDHIRGYLAGSMKHVTSQLPPPVQKDKDIVDMILDQGISASLTTHAAGFPVLGELTKMVDARGAENPCFPSMFEDEDTTGSGDPKLCEEMVREVLVKLGKDCDAAGDARPGACPKFPVVEGGVDGGDEAVELIFNFDKAALFALDFLEKVKKAPLDCATESHGHGTAMVMKPHHVGELADAVCTAPWNDIKTALDGELNGHREDIAAQACLLITMIKVLAAEHLGQSEEGEVVAGKGGFADWHHIGPALIGFEKTEKLVSAIHKFYFEEASASAGASSHGAGVATAATLMGALALAAIGVTTRRLFKEAPAARTLHGGVPRAAVELA